MIPPDDDPGALESPGADPSREVWFLNRNLVLLRARRPFLTWLLRKWDDARGLTLAELRARPTALLVPPFEDEASVWDWLEDHAFAFGHVALQDWFVPPELWPPDLDFEVLERWFDIELVECLWDMVDGELTSDPEGEPHILQELDEGDFASA